MDINMLKLFQKLPLDIKIKKSEQRIIEYYEKYNGAVYISFSGGKDSTVLLNIARKVYPNINVVFCNTGLEYPEIIDFIKTFDNITYIKPKINFKDVILKYGYPVLSKEQSQYIRQYKNAKSEKTKYTRINGNKWGRGKISKKWQYLLKFDIKISDQCCDIMKKKTF